MARMLPGGRVFLFLIITTSLSFRVAELPEERYIQMYKDLAIAEMHRAGIPASIKLAQAIVESRSGRSVLATRANNHFGIKCKSYWEGPRYYYVDDDRGPSGALVASCFRMYQNAVASYADHSDFLLTSSRYEELFEYEQTDYRNWASGLKKCGYATDPGYANRLVETIERFKLDRFDMGR